MQQFIYWQLPTFGVMFGDHPYVHGTHSTDINTTEHLSQLADAVLKTFGEDHQPAGQL